MKLPVLILSDLHLGHRVSRIDEVENLRPLIAGMGTVIFNGDTWEPLAKPFRTLSEAMLIALQNMCAQEGVEAIFLPGNHDPDWPGSGWVELADGRIVVTHGDVLLWASSPWKREIFHQKSRVREIWAEHPQAEHDIGERMHVCRRIARELISKKHARSRRFLKRVWDAVTPPQRALEILQAWWREGDAGAEFCRRYFPSAELLIIGHFHNRGTWLKRGIRTIDLGSFVQPGKASWATWDGTFLCIGTIDESHTPYRKDEANEVYRF